MHPYAVDSNERLIISFWLAIASICLILVIQTAIDYFTIILPWYVWYICAPSIFGFFTIFWICFDKWGWKASIVRTIGLIKTPDLTGTWHGVLRSSHEDHTKEHVIALEIYQNWTSISLIMRTQSSDSKSEVASLNTRNQSGPIISYQYMNEPRSHAPDTMNIHRGTAILTYKASPGILEGDYYTGRGRQKHGTIYLKREK